MTTQLRISASRVPMLLGQSKWGTPLSLYHELRGEAPPREDNELLQEGRDFEPVIIRQGCKRYGMRLVEGPRELVHGDLIGHPDGYVIDEHGKLAIVEGKNLLFADSGEEAGWGEAETDRVPMAYFLQCQVYGHLLMQGDDAIPKLSELEPGSICRAFHVEIDGEHGFACSPMISDTVYLVARLWHGVRRYRIKVDPEIIRQIELEASSFLDRVARGEPPDPTTGQEFRQRWSPVPEKAVEFTETQVALLKLRQQLKAQVKQAEAEVDKIDMQLLGYLRDASVGTFQGRRLLSAGADRAFDEGAFQVAHPNLYVDFARKLDREALKREHPGVYEQFLRLPPAEEQTRKLRPTKELERLK